MRSPIQIETEFCLRGSRKGLSVHNRVALRYSPPDLTFAARLTVRRTTLEDRLQSTGLGARAH
jgi:hypothetical protein